MSLPNPYQLLSSKLKNLPRAVKTGVIGVVLLFVSVAGIYAVSLPWRGTGDSPRHLDYVWQLSQGHLPRYESGIQYQPMRAITRDIGQHVSHHPPLFYALLALPTKSYLEKGEWHKAAAIGRTISILIGALTVIATAWAGWVFGGSKKELFAVGLPLIVVLQQAFLRVSGDIRGDTLVTLFSILSFTIIYKALKEGLKTKYYIALVTLSILGMATRAAYIATFITTLLGLFLAMIIHERRRIKPVLKSLALSSLALVLVVLATGWFYYFHNYKQTGSWIGAVEGKLLDWLTQVREYKDLPDVILNTDLYKSALHISDGTLESVSWFVTILVFGSCFWLIYKKRSQIKRLLKSKPELAITGLFVLQFLIVFYGQVKHGVGYGQLTSRYFLLTLLPIALVLAYGLLGKVVFRGQLLIAYAFFQIVTFFTVYNDSLKTNTILDTYTQNGLPVFILIILIALSIYSLYLVSRSITILALPDKRPIKK